MLWLKNLTNPLYVRQIQKAAGQRRLLHALFKFMTKFPILYKTKQSHLLHALVEVIENLPHVRFCRPLGRHAFSMLYLKSPANVNLCGALGRNTFSMLWLK
jgi:hypothetical protein